MGIRRLGRWGWILVALGVALAAAAVAYKGRHRVASLLAEGLASFTQGPVDWAGMEPNRWVRVNVRPNRGWFRQAHAGIAYDSKRGRVLVFGSDTHDTDWDNSVHEYDPGSNRWETHYPPAPKETYRADDEGRAVCGTKGDLPWAMHTFDNIVYDPTTDSLVVTAVPAHNPVRKEVPGVTRHPTWFYRLKTRTWEMLENGGKPCPGFFAAASAYDAARDTIVAYKKGGVWELGPERKMWRRATRESHHEIHFTMEYDSKRGVLAVFGDYRNSNTVWIYRPGPRAGDRGAWERREPGGDPVPRDQHFPVAFDGDMGVFLLVVDEVPEGAGRRARPHRAVTVVYDPDADRYTRLPKAEMGALGMNYMMVYDRTRKVFLLVTGDWKEPLTVWALRLERSAW